MKNLFASIVLLFSSIIFAQDTMYLMSNGQVLDQFNLNTEVDSVIFYNPVVLDRLPDPDTSLYPNLPEVLVTESGQEITNTSTWEDIRRGEILDFYTTQVYGIAPQSNEYSVSAVVESTTGIANGGTKKIIASTITGPNGSYTFRFPLFIPNSSQPVPVVVLVNHRGTEYLNATSSSSEFFPLDNLLLPRGYAAAVMDTNLVAYQDWKYNQGIMSVFNNDRATDWMMIQAWSFGVSRMIDYLVTDSAIDASKICTIGHSRGGKVSLLTAAQDERVALAMVNNAGCTGDALFRSNSGQRIQGTNDDFWWWFPDTYLAYNGQDLTIPYDQHQLISLIAPRLVAAGTAAEDAEADPVGQFHSYVFAQPAFALYGKTDTTWEVTDTPSLGTGPDVLMRNGNIQFHMRREGVRTHNLLLRDWQYYLGFADLKL